MTEGNIDPFAGAAEITPQRLSTGYSWTECPRWHDGALWFTDMYNHRLIRLDDAGEPETVLDASTRTSINDTEVNLGGFGWLPDGRLIVNSMYERLVLVYDGEKLAEYADLRSLATGPINDMVVDADGRAYVTQLGFELFQGEEPKDSQLLVVHPDGSAEALGDLGGFACANGIAISVDGRQVLTAEVFANRITVLDRDDQGRLSNRRAFAPAPALPDGICLDEDGGVWVGLPGTPAVARVVEGGAVTDVVRLTFEQGLSPACVLGGPDRRTLYICAGMEVMDWEKSRQGGLGSIWTAPVRVGGGTARP
jgi:sugar lactone lactonase YvrE